MVEKMHYFLLIAIFVFFDIGQGQKTSIVKGGRQLSCSESPIHSQPHLKAAVCTHWPQKGMLTKDVAVVTIHSANEPKVTQSMIKNWGLEQITTLHCHKCRIEQIDADAFSTLPLLQEIELAENSLKSIPANLFEKNPQISKIVLRNNRLEMLDGKLFSNFQSLNYVDISGNHLTRIPATFPPTLTQLYMADNRLEQIQFSQKLVNLQHLNMCQNNISVIDFTALGAFRLHSLCLGDRILQHKSFKGFGDLKELQELTLEKNRGPGSVSLQGPAFESIGKCSQLRILKIFQFEIPSLSILENLEHLETLVLNEVYVLEPPTSSYFRGLSRLETIDLSRSHYLASVILGSEDIRTYLDNVRHLKLQQCGIKDLNWVPDKSVSPFLPQLSTVDISHSTLDCHDNQIRKSLCLFSNLKNKAIDPDSRFNEIKGRSLQHPITLENTDSIECAHDEHEFVSTMDFSYCLDFPSEGNPEGRWPDSFGPLNNPTSSPDSFKDSQEEDKTSSNPAGYIILGIILALLVVGAVIFAVLWLRKRKGTANVLSAEQGIDKGQTTQTFNHLQQCSSSQSAFVENENQVKHC